MLEPITLPIAMSLSPFLAATTDVTSSGSDVPIATIVRPIRLSGIPNILAIVFAPSTVLLPPITIPAKPIAINNNCFHKGIIFSFLSSSGAGAASAVRTV